MGYRVWSAIQTFLGLLLGWVLLDSAVDTLFVYGFLEGAGSVWLSATAVIAYIVIAIVIVQLIKSIVIVVQD